MCNNFFFQPWDVSARNLEIRKIYGSISVTDSLEEGVRIGMEVEGPMVHLITSRKPERSIPWLSNWEQLLKISVLPIVTLMLRMKMVL